MFLSSPLGGFAARKKLKKKSRNNIKKEDEKVHLWFRELKISSLTLDLVVDVFRVRSSTAVKMDGWDDGKRKLQMCGEVLLMERVITSSSVSFPFF